MTVWRINVKGEPPPQFSWWKDGSIFIIFSTRFKILVEHFYSLTVSTM